MDYMNKFSRLASLCIVFAFGGSAFIQGSFAGEFLLLMDGKTDPKALKSTFEKSVKNNTGEQFFVVQFHEKVSESFKSQLVDRGFEIRGYLPEDALIVKGESQDATWLADLDTNIRAIVPYLPQWKFSRDLAENSFKGNQAERLLIQTFEKTDVESVVSDLKTFPQVSIVGTGSNVVVVDANLSHLARISEVQGIQWIQALPFLQTMELQDKQAMSPSKPTKPSPYCEGIQPGQPPAITGYETGTRILNFEAAWQRGFTGEGQTVAVADTGLDSGKMQTLNKDLSNTKNGYPMSMLLFGLPIGQTWADPQGHGTHVAGSVAGQAHNHSSDMLRGGAFGAELVAEGMWNTLFRNILVQSDFNLLFGKPYREDGARIHTNSWGSPQNLGAYDTMASNADKFMWENPKMLVLFAAGNSGTDKNKDGRIDEGSVSTPGTAKNVLTVGASENLVEVGGKQKTWGEFRKTAWGVEPIASDTPSDNPNGIAAFSSRGPTRDGRLKPEVVAPGTNILSVRSKAKGASDLWCRYNDDYSYSGGTSMSTPLVAGAAAVAREYLIKQEGFSEPSGALVKAALIHNAFDLFPGQYGTGPKQELPTRRPNMHEGYGLVDMAAVTDPNLGTVYVESLDGVGLGETEEHSFRVMGGKLRVTLSYTDYPGQASASQALVNDLDVQVIGPEGKVHELKDRKNNIEMLELSQLVDGNYTVVVKGVNVPQGKNGKQPYALAVTFL